VLYNGTAVDEPGIRQMRQLHVAGGGTVGTTRGAAA
jgi:hypothetical protein